MQVASKAISRVSERMYSLLTAWSTETHQKKIIVFFCCVMILMIVNNQSLDIWSKHPGIKTDLLFLLTKESQ